MDGTWSKEFPLETKKEGDPDWKADFEKMQVDVKSALSDLMNAVEKKNEVTVKNLTEHLTKYTSLAEKWEAEQKAAEKSRKELEEKAEGAEKRVKDLELKIATGGFGHNGGPAFFDDGKPNPDCPERSSPEYKAFFDGLFARNVDKVAPETKALLRTDQDVAGGYLIPPIMDGFIRKKVVELSPTRAFATVRTMTSKSMTVPKRLALLDSSYEGEAEEDSQDASKYGEDTVTAFRHSVTVPITLDQLIMSPFNMEQEISSDVGQSFAKKEGKLHLVGTGRKMPEGILVNPEVLAGKRMTVSANIVNFDDIANLIGGMKVGYNPCLFFNRLTFAQLIQLKDTMGRPIWTPVAGDKPATIWDQPYTSTFIDMDSMVTATYSSGTLTANATAGSIPIMYADLAQGYEIFDLMGMTVIRDDVTGKRKAIIEYTFRRYNTAKVLMAEAIKVLKVS